MENYRSEFSLEVILIYLILNTSYRYVSVITGHHQGSRYILTTQKIHLIVIALEKTNVGI